MCISQHLNSDEQPCAQEEQYNCKRCVGRLFAMSVHAATEVLDKLGVRSFKIEQRDKMIPELSFMSKIYHCLEILA